MNKTFYKKLLKILSNKPELITNFPDWILSKKKIEKIKKEQDVAISEIAGRDSFAAVIKACELRNFKAIVPTIAYTGTEFGNWEITFKKVEKLKATLKALGIKTYNPIILGAPRLWKILCGRYSLQHYRKFKYYSPCLGCHTYLHAIRIPLAKILNCKVVIGGERELHDEQIKINQINIAIESYIKLFKKFDLELFLPIRYISSGNEIERILGYKWGEGKEQLECVLSGNYRESDGSVIINRRAIKRYFNEFALNIAENFIREHI